MRKFITVAAAVCLLWLGLGATPAPAQILRGGGGRVAGVRAGGGFREGRFARGYRDYGYRNYGYGYGYAPFLAVGVYGAYPYYGGGYYSEPSYTFSGPVYSYNGSSNGALVYGGNTGDTRQSFYSPAGTSSRATVRVTLPSADAKVYFDDNSTAQSGTDRVFNTPTLEPDKSYTYTVRATWMEDGKEMTRSKDVKVQAGREATIDMRIP